MFDLAFSPVPCLITTGLNSNLESDILGYLSMMATNMALHPDPCHLAPLLRLAAVGVEAITIWETLFGIFSKAPNSSSTSSAISNFRAQTPVSSNSYSLSPTAEQHQVIDQRLRHELDGVLYPNVPGFIDTFFPIDSVIHQIYQNTKPVHLSDDGWIAWPSPPAQNSVLRWFLTFVNNLLPGTSSHRYATSPNTPLLNSGAIGKRKPDLFLCDRDLTHHHWSDVLVVGELKQSKKDSLSPTPIVEFAGYIRMIFICQPYRRFVHAFTLSGDMMRCWIFHRGGGFASELFSINRTPEICLRVLVGYATKSRTDLGFDPTVSLVDDSGHRHLTLSGQRYLLKPEPFFVTHAIACRGTICTEAKLPGDTAYDYVVKDAWRSHCYGSEGLLLFEAQQAGVQCLVEYVDHEDIRIDGFLDDILTNIMRGLDLTGIKPIMLRPLEPRPTRSSQTFAVAPFSSEPARPPSDHIPRPPSPTTRLKRSYPSSLTQSPAKRISPAPGNSTPTTDNLSFNRVHTRLVTVKGRPIKTFATYLELLLTFHDAITCHRALLRHGVLHRDISLTNILIPLTPRSDSARGMLIDLDLALCLGSSADGTAHHRTGTMEFMAIGALSREPHTYRHDLESFFYVFLWLCVHYLPGGDKVMPHPTTLDAWGTGSYLDAAARKSCDMEPGGFRRIVAGFSNSAEGMGMCAAKWREVLFPWRGLVWMGTDADYEGVYARVLEVIAEAVGAEGGQV